MHRYYKTLFIIFFTAFNCAALVGQKSDVLIFDNLAGISSYVPKKFNVNSKQDLHVDIEFNNNSESTIYVVGDEKLSKVRLQNKNVKIENLTGSYVVFNSTYLKIFKVSGISSNLVQAVFVVEPGSWKNPITVLNEKNFQRLGYQIDKKSTRNPFFDHLTRSFSLVMFLFGVMAFILFCIARINIYLYYSLFAFVISFYYANKVAYLSNALYGLIGIDGIHLLNNCIQPIMYYYLTLFVYEILEVKHRDRFFARLLIYFTRLSLIAAVLIAITFFIDQGFSESVYNLYRLIIILFSGYITFYLILKRFNTATVIIGYSNLFLIIMGSIAMITSIKGIVVNGIAPLDYFTIGMVVFITGVTAALGLRARDTELERISAKESIIELERNAKEKLESDLQVSQLRERNNQVERDLADLELLVLRNQLNPHFLYNSMNTLKLYILNNENIDAAKFIDRFSGLFRKVLNNSRQRLITLSDEIQAMEQYLDLERIRFRDAFTYSIEVDESIDPTFTRIPPMIFQPFLENSINHGIGLNENRAGHISINIAPVNDEYYRVTIVDNGVGREYAQKIKTNKISSHKSLGTQIIEDRLTAINKLYNYHSYFEYTDLYNDNNTANGTRVDVILPQEL